MNTPAYQKELFTKRYRKVRAPQPSETQIQTALVERFNLMGRNDAVCFHVPNGGWRFKRSAGILKAMGVLPGVSDLIFLWPERNALFLELKAAKRVMTPAQEKFAWQMKKCGFAVEWADNLDEALAILMRYGLLTKTIRRVC
jgi:hypothetical protein